MQQIIPHKITGTTFLLSADRCIYWEEKKILILSDLHFGKTGHFRKSGIGIPQTVFKEDVQRFVSLLQTFKPTTVVVIGDMFHSHDNKEHELFLKWRKDFEQLEIKLIMGNHDILHQKWYQDADIEMIKDHLRMDQFSFIHDINECEMQEDVYCFSGHIHPGINIGGTARQSVHLPCFYFSKQYAVLPAFGKFTGTFPIKPKRGENVFAVMPANQQQNEKGGILKVC